MNELNREDEIRGNAPSSVASLDAQLTELIEFVWALRGRRSPRRPHRRSDQIRSN